MEAKNLKEMIANVTAQHGGMPNPLKLMEKRPGTLERFLGYSKHVFESGPLSKKEKALIAVATTVALRAEHCIHTKIDEARKAGISEEEIVQTILMAGQMAGNTTMHTAYEAFADQQDAR